MRGADGRVSDGSPLRSVKSHPIGGGQRTFTLALSVRDVAPGELSSLSLLSRTMLLPTTDLLTATVRALSP